jgi:hypothetical protein
MCEHAKVLFLSANPRTTRSLDIDKEIQTINRSFGSPECRDRLELEHQPDLSPDGLPGALWEHKPNVFHFSGHCSEGGQIILHRGDAAVVRDLGPDLPTVQDDCVPVPPEALAELFAIHLRDLESRGDGTGGKLQVVVLNACYTDELAKAIVDKGGVDCAVGFDCQIEDSHAIAFASEFYRVLAFGDSVGSAIDHARNLLWLKGVRDPKNVVRFYVDRSRGIEIDEITIVRRMYPREAVPATSEREDPVDEQQIRHICGDWAGAYFLEIDKTALLEFYVEMRLAIESETRVRGTWRGMLKKDYGLYKAGRTWCFAIHGRYYQHNGAFLRLDYDASHARETRFGALVLKLGYDGERLSGKIAGFSTIAEDIVTGTMTLTKRDRSLSAAAAGDFAGAGISPVSRP